MKTRLLAKIAHYANKQSAFTLPAAIWHSPSYFIAFGFGSGAVPIAPGTMGTLMAIPFYQLLASLLSTPVYCLLISGLMLVSMKLLDRISKEMHVHDHPGMCLDEFIGYFVTMIGTLPTAQNIILGFLLFRLFDIWKPWPIYHIDRSLTGGVGMVLDDVLAGGMAMLILQGINLLTGCR